MTLEFQNRDRRRDRTLIFVARGVAEGFTGAGIHRFNGPTASCHQDGIYPITAEAMPHCVHPFSDLLIIVFQDRDRMLLRTWWFPGKSLFADHL